MRCYTLWITAANGEICLTIFRHTRQWPIFYAAIRSGLWEKIRVSLVERVRTQAGRNAGPSYAIIDSQSVKTTSAAEERGIDGGKKQKDANGTS